MIDIGAGQFSEGAAVNPRNALVVGASASIAAAVIKRLNSAGIRVLAAGRSCPVDFQIGARLKFASLDLLRRDTFDTFCQSALPEFGAIDIAIFLAGILPGKSLADYGDDMLDEVMETNFTSQAALLRRLLPYFSSDAHVIMVSSVSGERGSFDPIYAASKAAQIAFVKSLATWLSPALRVNALAPALIADSTMAAAMTPERRAHHIAQTPTRRLTTMDEIAGVVVDLCSPAWSNLNGQVIRINGGAHV